MLELLRRAVVPYLSLRKAMDQWANISHQLAELPQNRFRQLDRTAALSS